MVCGLLNHCDTDIVCTVPGSRNFFLLIAMWGTLPSPKIQETFLLPLQAVGIEIPCLGEKQGRFHATDFSLGSVKAVSM